MIINLINKDTYSINTYFKPGYVVGDIDDVLDALESKEDVKIAATLESDELSDKQIGWVIEDLQSKHDLNVYAILLYLRDGF